MKPLTIALLTLAAACTTPPATTSNALTGVTVSVVHQFDPSVDGAHPRAALVLGPDGRLYGTTEAGGTPGGGGRGTVFAVSTDGAYEVLHAFSPLDTTGRNPDGATPLSAVTFGTDGYIYGTTELGGEGGNPLRPAVGVIYRVSPEGDFTKMYDFGTTPAGLANPIGGLVPYPSADGAVEFVGTTTQNNGSIYEWSPSSGITVLHVFKGRAPDGTNYGGLNPYSTPVFGEGLGKDGLLRGMNFIGGANGRGCIYKIDPTSGVLTPLYDFPSYTFTGNTDNTPLQALYAAPDGSYWGLTEFDGENGSGMLFRITGDFVTIIHEFSTYSALATPRFSSSDGLLPISSPVLAPDGWLYFTTFYGGAMGTGSIQRIRPDGRGLERVYDFGVTATDTTSPGAYPYAGLTVGADGALYGTTFLGAAGYGAVYRVEVGQ